LQKKITKTNRPLWVGMLEDFTGNAEFVMFSDAIEKFGEMITDGGKVIINGRLQFRGGDDSETYSVVVNDVRPIQDVQPMHVFFEQVPKWEDLIYISQLLAKHRGYNPVILNFQDGTRIKTGARYWINGNAADLKTQLESHFPGIVRVG